MTDKEKNQNENPEGEKIDLESLENVVGGSITNAQIEETKPLDQSVADSI